MLRKKLSRSTGSITSNQNPAWLSYYDSPALFDNPASLLYSEYYWFLADLPDELQTELAKSNLEEKEKK
ncbi:MULTISPECIES: hypothetical protein [Photorhabdus]|uniref:Uncharacterized protein n=2 Tax=Photorhabdus asymbiotica TaxID=291112 RepID=B6VLC0_PHOAA|nr:hypothetical protein [Photorhabdus asymbiotica]RKS59750.1 hypothetical protein BDD30_1837 [Photorhabdus asymbiotica]CAQ85894.1 Hypothetical protein PAU_03806 [Photorhabdus asymbiotica]CAR66950.1 Hypothetical protein PA-RVA7-0652 [Photorhabdus asymbiotica subsp. asymbiotica ATCC 43949]